MNIYPTGSCFDDAIEIIKAAAKNGQPNWRNMIIIHGICVDPGGKKFSHAWVEDNQECLWMGIIKGETVIAVANRTEFYEYMSVQDTTAYTIEQAVHEERRTGKCGPWEQKYLDLCKQDEEPEPRYRLTKDTRTGAIGIWCAACDKVSYHQDDVKNRYCAKCRTFFE